MKKLLGLVALLIGCSGKPQEYTVNVCEGTARIPIEAFEVQQGDSYDNYVFNGYIRSTADYTFITPTNYVLPEGAAGVLCYSGRTETHLDLPPGIFAELNDLDRDPHDPYGPSTDVINKKLFHPGKSVFVIPDYEDQHGYNTKMSGDYVSKGIVGYVTVTIEPFSPSFPTSDEELYGTNSRAFGKPLSKITSFQPRYRTEDGGPLKEPLRTFSISLTPL